MKRSLEAELFRLISLRQPGDLVEAVSLEQSCDHLLDTPDGAGRHEPASAPDRGDRAFRCVLLDIARAGEALALSNAEKQAHWRARRKQRIRDLEWRVVELLEENIKPLQENERLRNRAPPRSNP
jgi:hypothetical protein